MLGLFDIATQDQSVYYLGQLFGSVGNVIPQSNPTSTVLGAMFKTLNTTALMLGSIMVIHTVVVGLIKTAHEGEFLGKQWNSLWVPLRTVMGIAALFPTLSGYSVMQVVMMWFIIQGVGAADSLWTTVLNYVSIAGSPYGSMTMGSPTIGVQGTMQTLFAALVCQAEAARKDTDQIPGAGDYFYCAQSPSANFCNQSPQDILNITGPNSNVVGGIVNYQIGPNGGCGTLQFADPKTYKDTSNNANSSSPVCSGTDIQSIGECAGAVAQVPLLQNVVNTLGALAVTIANVDHQYMTFFTENFPVPIPNATPAFIANYCTANSIPQTSCCLFNASGSSFPSPCRDSSNIGTSGFPNLYIQTPSNDFTSASPPLASLYWTYALAPILGSQADIIGTNTNYLIGNVQAAVTAAMMANAPALGNWEAAAQSTGWLMAGAYYYRIASTSNAGQKASLPLVMMTNDPGLTAPTTSSSPMAAYRNNYTATGNILSSISAATSTTLSASSSPQAQAASSSLNSASSGIMNNFEQEMTGSTGGASNPLIDAQGFGESLLITAQVLYPSFVLICVGILVLASLNGMGLGTGLTMSPAEAAVLFTVYSLWAIIMFFCGWCITFGGMLAIYVPIIPYILFTFASIGWFMATVEAMTAAPFVALGILSPSGQHELLGRAEPALLILLNTFLRPSLMVMGMMAGMLLTPLVVQMINNGYNAVIGSIYGNAAPGPVEMMLFVTSYATLVVTAMNKCFALIYLVPEKVLTYIGGHAISYGEGDAQQAMKGAHEGATGTMKGAASKAGKGAISGTHKALKKEDEKGGGGKVT